MNENNSNQSQQISDEDLWVKAGNGQPISRSDIGIGKTDRSDGLQTINEGLNVHKFDNSNRKDIRGRKIY